jgi:hypothetical protein
MTRKKVAVSIAYVAVFLQLATYLARDTGWLSDGGLYTTLLYATSITLLGAVLWLARLRFRSQHEAQPAEPGKGANRIEKTAHGYRLACCRRARRRRGRKSDRVLI